MVKLDIVGAGPGSIDYVTPLARKIVSEAQIVIGAQRSLDLFNKDMHCEICVLTAKNLHELLKYAVESNRKGKAVVILSTGDPGFSGLLKTVLNTRLITLSEINVTPGISVIQICAAKLGLSWDEAGLFTFHQGDADVLKKTELIACLKAGKDAMLLPDARAFTPKHIANYLLDAGFSSDTVVFVCENVTLSDERIVKSSLGAVSVSEFEALCVMVIKAKCNSENV